MKLFKNPLTYFVPFLVAGLVSCGGPSEDELNSMADDVLSDIATEVEDDIVETPEEVVETSGSYDFTSEDGHFTITFPGEPSDTAQSVPTEVGDIEMVQYMYQKSVTEVFMVAYSDYPSSMVNESNAEDLLAGGKTGALNSLGIVSTDTDESIEIDGHPGNYFTANNGQFFVAYEMYLVNNRLYQIAILRDGSYPSQAEVDAFTKTFALTEAGK